MGHRWSAPSFVVAWNVGATRDTWRGKRPVSPQEGRVVDISVSGASLLAPVDQHLQRGSRVVVGFEQERSLVSIRRISARDDDGLVIYGIEFIDPPAHMVARLMERATGRADEDREERWNRSV